MKLRDLLNPFFVLKQRRSIVNALRRRVTGMQQTATPEAMARLQQLHNSHIGERCAIIGMGPSLRTADLDRLKNTPTFACNKIFLAFEQTDWRPTYYTVSDVLVAENNRSEIMAMTAEKLFPGWVSHRMGQTADVLWIPVAVRKPQWRNAGVGFSTNLLRGIQPGGGTVVYDQLQIAFHMGFSEVVIIGLDFSFTGIKPTGEKCEQGEVLIGQGEINHFHKDYRKPGETWTMPKLDEQRRAFRVAKQVFAEAGRKLVNASRKTMLEELERDDFDRLFPL